MTATTTGKHLFMYDEDCGFCSLFAEKLQRWSRTPLEVVPIQIVGTEDAGGLLDTLTDDELWASAHYIRPDGREFHGGASVTRALRLLPGGGVFAVLDLPGVRVVRDRVYFMVAHNRHHISRLLGMDHCKVRGV